jgi:hypothetical protein
MLNAAQAIDLAIKEVARLKTVLSKSKDKQIQSGDERNSIKATSLSWFNAHRNAVIAALADSELSDIDASYKKLLESCEKRPARAGVTSEVKALHAKLVKVRSEKVIELMPKHSLSSSDSPPSFSKLVSDSKMQEILKKRWIECTSCLDAGVPLAATVMMGGLLEGLLLARINQESNKTSIFTAKATPKDKKTGNPFSLKDWGLSDFISVAHELKWISESAKDVGVVLRDYRNYIHPQKEFSHGVDLRPADALILWGITKSISLQLL